MGAYVQYMPAGWVCIGVTYADGKHMRMSALCRCVAYGYAAHILFSHFFTADPKKGSSGSPSDPPALCGRRRPYPVVTVAFRRDDTPYVVSDLSPSPPVLHTGKRRFAYFPAVVHFRKVVIRKKVGSDRNGHSVIYMNDYMTTYYKPENDDGRGKSSW